VIRPAPLIAALPASTPFIGPERLMRENRLTQLVRLGANESPFGPSPLAVAAMRAELERLSWYGDPDAYELRVALAKKHACAIEQISVGSGIDDLMGLAVRAYVAPGAAAVTSRGTYPTFEYHVSGYGGVLQRVDYREDGAPDLEGLVQRAHECDAAIVYLANPDNPSGSFYERDEVVRFFEALPRSTVLLLDEAYADFVDEAELLPPHFEDRLIRTRTFSKAHGMAGARIGYAIMSEEGAATFDKIRLQYGINRNAQIGALASLHDAPFSAFVVEETARGRAEYADVGRELGIGTLPSRTNFVCFDLRDVKRANSMVVDLLRRGVWIRKPGAWPLDRYIRVSVGTAPMRAAFAAALRAILSEVPA
jgi:histidinol-phosphate aminotransferase